MTTTEILERCEANRTLFGATKEELISARTEATREIHRYVLDTELTKRAKEERAARQVADNLIPKKKFSHSGPRVPTKRELR